MALDERLRLKEDLVPVSTLQAKTSRVLREVETEGRYKVITREGVALAVLMGVDDFEHLRMDAVVGRLLREIRQSEAEIAAGEGTSHDQMEQEFRAQWGHRHARRRHRRRRPHRPVNCY